MYERSLAKATACLFCLLVRQLAPGTPAEAQPARDEPGAPLSERIVGRDVAYAFPPLDEPETRPAGDAGHMRPDDVVAGLLLSGAARAYPWWVLKNYHAVNDTFQGVGVLVAFCEQCSAATAFRREIDGRVLSMETEGVCGGSIILRDRETSTLWAPFDGHGMEGPLASRKLARLPVYLTTWQDWRTRHPETDVVYGDPRTRSGHGSREHPGKWGVVGQMGETLRSWDPRLPENDFVYGAAEGSGARAYPFREVQERGGVVNDTLAGRPIVVLARGSFEMVAYDRRVNQETLTFEPSGSGAAYLRDVETGSAWSVEGAATSGRLAGARLELVEGYSVEWHVWSEYHPETEIFSHTPYRPPTGFRIPVTSLPRLVGERVREENLLFDADVNLILVWARWCLPCREKLPLMKRLAAEEDEHGYRFQSIALQLHDEIELSSLKSFLHQNGIDWPIYFFDDSRYLEVDRTYRREGGRGIVIPTVFFADRSGTVLRVLEGEDVAGARDVVKELAGSDSREPP